MSVETHWDPLKTEQEKFVIMMTDCLNRVAKGIKIQIQMP